MTKQDRQTFVSVLQGIISTTPATSRELSKPRDSPLVLTFPIAVEFDRHLDSSAIDTHVKTQNDMIITTTNLAASRLHEILRLRRQSA